MRDLIVFGIVMLSLPMAFRRPFIGLLVFSWLAYMRPQDLCWLFARNMRFSFFVAITMTVGWLANEAGRRPFWRRDIRTVLMLLLLGITTVGLLLAEDQGSYVMRYYVEFVKIIGIALFTTGQVDSKQRLRMLLWTITMCLGFYGFKGGLFGLLSGGSVIMRGPGGMLEDNNDFALALTMNIPLLFYMGRTEKNPLLRRGCDLTIAFTVITILLTHSRGAFLSTVAVSMLLAWRSGKLFRAIGFLGLCAVMFFAFAPVHVRDRIALIGQGSAEGSANARITAWRIASRMIQANPVVGVGIRNFQAHYTRHGEGILRPGQVFRYVAHNSYLQIWAEGGTLSFVVYMMLLSSVYFATRWIRMRATYHMRLNWAFNYARMMEATTAGFCIGAVFLNRGHFDLVYHWLALLSCFLFVFKLEYAKTLAMTEGEQAGPSAPTGIKVSWKPAVAGVSGAPVWRRRV